MRGATDRSIRLGGAALTGRTMVVDVAADSFLGNPDALLSRLYPQIRGRLERTIIFVAQRFRCPRGKIGKTALNDIKGTRFVRPSRR
jgi:hypothetical protein